MINPTKLGNYFTFENGRTRPDDEGFIPVYGGNGILGFSNKANMTKGIIIGRVGAFCGSVNISREPCWVSDNAIKTIPNDKIDIEYAFYLLKHLNLNTYHLGSSQPMMTQEILKEIAFPIPDLPTQKKIADVLSCIDDKIALNNKTNSELENMAKTVYDYWFTQFDFPDANGNPYKSSGGKMEYNQVLKREIPAGWEVKQLRTFLDCNKNSISKANNYSYINYLDTGSLTENVISEYQIITDTDALPSRAKRIVQKNNIFVLNDFIYISWCFYFFEF